MSTLSQCLVEALINLIEDELKKRGYICGGEKEEQFSGLNLYSCQPCLSGHGQNWLRR